MKTSGAVITGAHLWAGGCGREPPPPDISASESQMRGTGEWHGRSDPRMTTAADRRGGVRSDALTNCPGSELSGGSKSTGSHRVPPAVQHLPIRGGRSPMGGRTLLDGKLFPMRCKSQPRDK